LFNTALDATTNVDTLMDFNSADDTFWLSSTIFSSLTPGGVIDADQFQIGSAALDAEDRIVYDQTYGIVMYDPDGTGAAPAVQFAQVMLGQSLAYNDFVVPW
jgi:serralysin